MLKASPFQINIIEKPIGSKGTYILGGSELTDEEKEIIEAFIGNTKPFSL